MHYVPDSHLTLVHFLDLPAMRLSCPLEPERWVLPEAGRLLIIDFNV